MRKIFKEQEIGWIRLQQGVIFSGAIADGITNSSDLYGLVITPRCDIANHKVSTIHYLPLIPFDLWKYEILSKSYQKNEIEKLTRKLVAFCKENSISESLFENQYNFTDAEIESSLCRFNGYKDILNIYHERCKVESLDYCKKKVKNWSGGKDKIKELIENKQAHYFLIEDWRKDNSFFVIMLRDIKRLDFAFAEKMEKGVSEKILQNSIFDCNDIFKSNSSTMVYKFQRVVESPFLEYIMEAFSKNFCRIGIDRIEESVLDDLKNV